MMTLISGGAASGKSEYAEALALRSPARPLVYLATMEIWDEEDRRRRERHRLLRQGKGFLTVEASRHLETVTVPPESTVLLECMSNLCVNECFGAEGFGGAEDRIRQGVEHLSQSCRELIVVTNELFSDGRVYDEASERYKQVLARLNRTLAAQADRVCEVCCGIPIWWKGSGEWANDHNADREGGINYE